MVSTAAEGSVSSVGRGRGSAGLPITPRAFPIEQIGAHIPKHWLAGSVLATHLANGVNLLFPAGERFFVRSVRRYLSSIADDPALMEAVRGFAGQEGHHARAHEQVFEMLEQQGYRVKPYLRVYEKIAYSFIERLFPPVLRLSATAACEHFTAILAENFLRESHEATMDPVLRRLMTWHAVEEIEHRSVAFDVLSRVDDRYFVRIAGLAVASVMLAGFWIGGTGYLLAQEPSVVSVVRREAASMKGHHPFGERVFGRGIKAYLARGFHPSDNAALDALAKKALAEIQQDMGLTS
ncbi:MAG: metal-dependent hydrolase [Polyangiaceae bacterium]